MQTAGVTEDWYSEHLYAVHIVSFLSRFVVFLNDNTFCSESSLCGFNIQREDYGYFIHNDFLQFTQHF